MIGLKAFRFLSHRTISRLQRRTFIGGLLSSSLSSERKKFSEERILGYSPPQVFNVVANVDDYHLFLPWCLESRVLRRFSPEKFNAKLVVGFPPLTEKYISDVSTSGTHYLKSVCRDGLLFSHLIAEWHFDDGPAHPKGQTCLLKFFVDFKFKSGLHSSVAHLFFNEVVRTMAAAFEKRCSVMYGPDFLKQQHHRRSRHSASERRPHANDYQ
jgi:coenzyme Q-binding protein COQ10